VLADWIPLYLKSERGFTFVTGNAFSVLVYAGLDAGNLLIGFYVKRLVASGWTVAAARNSALLVSCVLMSASVLTGFTPRYAALACLIHTATGVAGFLVIYFTLVQNLDPPHVGACSGLLGGLGNLSYGLVSPYIGRLFDLHQSTLTFLIIGSLLWLALASVALGTRAQQH